MNPFAWILSKVDKKQRVSKWGAAAKAFINKKPLLKKLAQIAVISYTVVNIVTQLISWPAFSTALGRKNSTLKEDYAAAVVCLDKTKRNEACTVKEMTSLKKAWDNDILMCYGNGNGCLVDLAINSRSVPKQKDMRIN